MLLDSLDSRLLRANADRLGFGNAGHLEKFIADFDAHAVISRSLTCHVRGGLCFPFHVDNAAHRLSTDLDLYTAVDVDDVSGEIPDLLTAHGFTSVTTHWRSRKNMHVKQLVRFNAKFKSKFGATSSINVDVACRLDPGLIATVTVPSGYGLLGIRTEHEISVLSMGSLMADKIMSLGIGTVGYESLSSTPKQIYDVGKLIQHAGVTDLEHLMSTYGKLTEFKLSRDNRGHTQKEVMESIMSYIDDLGHEVATPGLASHWSHFKTFSKSMLSQHQQAQGDHLERILLISACSRFLSRSLEPGASPAEEAAGLYATLDEARAKKETGEHLEFLRKRLGLAA
ncbi:MAG: nucleotidyl transferase AbiEii/AbiGii toxin family protein [Thaumarchaeota archaeon]|nr:nucleotidyl transferase AbiEii/AbiGii toxin family protein [Nitrososphaerota archaeon]